MLKIRLMRIGAKKKPFYRVVVVEERSKRTGGYVELLGTYNPLTEPKDIKLNKERIEYWTKQGAQPTTGYLRIIGKAPQRLPRKAKKEKKEAPKAPEVATESVSPTEIPATQEATTEQPVVEIPVEQSASAEEVKAETAEEQLTEETK